MRGVRRTAPGPYAGGPAPPEDEDTGTVRHTGADQEASRTLGEAVRPGPDQGGGQGGGDRDQPGEERGAFRPDALHPAVPADETDHGDDDGLPQQRRRLATRRDPQERAAVQQQPEQRRLDGRDAADRRGEELRTQRPQDRDGQDREADLARERAHREQHARQVGAPPALDGERPDGDEACRVQRDAGRTTAVQQRDEHADHDRRTAHEDARNSRFRRLFGRQDRQVEPDHAHGGEQDDPPPLATGEASEPSRRGVGVAAKERDEQQRGETVAERLAARERIVAEDAVGREGCPHQHTREGREEGPAQRGCVHGADARVGDGPV